MLTLPNVKMNNEKEFNSKRLYSLDALRGFDMFWIIGGKEIFLGLSVLTGWPVFQWWSDQLKHVAWHGFHFYDMIFPLFLFIAGISFPFSLAKRRARNDSSKSIYKHIIIRALILVLLGILYVNGLRFNFGEMQFSSVLGRIGLAWMCAALIFMNTKLSYRIVWFWGLLIGYWILLLLFPAHDLGATDPFSQEGNLAGYIDRLYMPGTLFMGNYTPQGFLSTLPSIGMPLLGMFTGEFLMSKYMKDKPFLKIIYMASAAIILLVIGKLWNIVFPINKNLWSSSFICFSGGISLLLFSVFYLIIDVLQYKRWAFFFVVIGMNPITIYLTEKIIDFKYATHFLFGGFADLLPDLLTPLIEGCGLIIIVWVFLYYLYRKKIFFKI